MLKNCATLSFGVGSQIGKLRVTPAYHIAGKAFISSTNVLHEEEKLTSKKSWLDYNDVVYPPQEPGEERRPAFVCHERRNIKYSPKKMWYIAAFVRGMSVDEAVKQLKYIPRKGAVAVREVILEAQKKAVEEHHVEFKTNLWVAESFARKGTTVKGIRRHAMHKIGVIHYRYCHYFVRLEEGPPPEIYYWQNRGRTGPELLDKWLTTMRNRNIKNSL